MKYKIILAVVLAALVAPAAFASGDIDVSGLIKPGLYSITATVNVEGVGKMPPRTTTNCLSKDDVDNFSKNMAAQLKKSNGKVQIKDMTLDGKDLHFTMVTAKGNMNFDMVFDDPTHYHQTITGVMMGHKMTMHSKAHRIGDCKKKSTGS